jgi:hypothetical protein
MTKRMTAATLAVAVTLTLSGFALAQRDRDDDDDHNYYRQGSPAQAHQYGYENGYRDGLRKGEHESRENDPGDFRGEEWRSASNGYQPWMGPFGTFRDGYRDGYQAGFRAGFQNGRWRDRDRDDDGDGRYNVYGPPWYGNGNPRYAGNPGYRIGYRDGSSVAREDMAKGKPYNPNPRGPYDDEDHGYRSEYGSKSAYKSQYANGYRSGYQASFRNRY